MKSDALTRADRCFALARSTTFEAERATAIAAGTRIAEAAGLSLDLFDIPGRARPEPAGRMDPPPASRYRDDLFKRGRSPFSDGKGFTEADFSDVMKAYRRDLEKALRAQAAQAEALRRAKAEQAANERAWQAMNESLARARERAGARAEETPYDAQRRNFNQATADAKRRDDEREKLKRVERAVDSIWLAGYRVYRTADALDGSRRWFAILADGEGEITDDDVLRLVKIGEEKAKQAAMKDCE